MSIFVTSAAQATFSSNAFQFTSVHKQNKFSQVLWMRHGKLHPLGLSHLHHILDANKPNDYASCLHTFWCLLFNSACFSHTALVHFANAAWTTLPCFSCLCSHFLISVPLVLASPSPVYFTPILQCQCSLLFPSLQFLSPLLVMCSWVAAESTVMVQTYYNLQSISFCSPLYSLLNNFNSARQVCGILVVSPKKSACFARSKFIPFRSFINKLIK